MASSQRSLIAHIPMSCQDPLLMMSSAIPFSGVLPTIFLGIVDGDSYTDEMWERHAYRLTNLFAIDAAYVSRVKVGQFKWEKEAS